MPKVKENKKEEAGTGTHSISIPRKWVPEIESLIEEIGGHSVNSFCQQAVRDVIDMMTASRDRRLSPKLVSQIDAIRTRAPFSSIESSDAGALLNKADEGSGRGAGQ